MPTPAISRTLRTLFCAVLLVCLANTANAATQSWYPVEVDVWEPPFNAQRQRSQFEYTPLSKASQSWQICASIPHLKDAYWLAVNYGLIAEAAASASACPCSKPAVTSIWICNASISNSVSPATPMA